MPSTRRIILVANSKSGSTAETALGELQSALLAVACAVEVFATEQPAELPALAHQAREAAPDVVVAVGGDGTVNTVANALAGSEVAMGVAPRGTFNYVARQYRLPDTPSEIAALLAAGDARPIGAGVVNGRLFLNNCSFGLYTDVIHARERHKAQWGRYRLVAVASALATALRSRARLPLRLSSASGELRHHGRASLLFAGVNPSQFADSGFEIGEQVSAGALGFVVVDAISPWRIVSMLAGAAMGTVEQLQHVTAFCEQALRVELPRRRSVEAVIDGEIVRLAAPLRFDYRPAALKLVAPALAATAPPA